MLRGVIPTILIVIVGIVVGRWDASRHQLTLAKLTQYVFLPCLAFSALHKHAFDPGEVLRIVVASFGIITVMTVVAVVVLGERWRGGSRNILATVYMSSGTLLLPLAFVLFGNEGLAKAIYFHLVVLFAYHTVGLWLVDGTTDLKGFLRTPFIYLVLLGVAARVSPVSMPEQVEEFAWLAEKGIDLTAMGALPLLLISFGYPLGLLRLSDARSGWTGGLLRTIAGPLVALLVVYICRKTGFISMARGYDVLGYIDQRTTEALLVLGAAMPTSNHAMRLVGDEVTAGKAEAGTLLVSALVSSITIPVALLVILICIFTD
jgi:predicted permease